MELICANCHKVCSRIRKKLCDTCYTKYRIHGDPNYSLAGIPSILTEQQNNLIIGSMLGDGHLRRKKEKHNTALNIARCQADYQYLEWEAKIVDNLFADVRIAKREYCDHRTGNTYYGCYFTTRALVVLNEYHTAWYKNKVKIVPNDLKLNAEIIAIWFCDDGTITTSSSDNRLKMSFATNSFTKDEVYFLRDLLDDRYNETFLVSELHKKGQYIIHCSDAAARTLIADIDPVFPQGMQRKRLWDDPKTCFYENAPPKRRSHFASSAEKRSKILEYIETHEEFYLTELGEYAGFAFDRKSRTGNNAIATSNIKRHYLPKLIEDGVIIELGRQKGDDYRKGVKYKRIKKPSDLVSA
jgi:LAGLIDADG DNA endonuclease family